MYMRRILSYLSNIYEILTAIEIIILQTETLKALVSDRKYLEGNSNKLFDSQFCEPCKTEEKTAKATHFCENCNTFICESCKNCHSKFEVLRLHTFVPVNKSSVCLMNEKTVLQYLFNCNHCHREENFVETYCENHKEFMCMMCADLKHKDCDCSSINQDFLFNNAHMDEMLLKAQSVKEEI